MKQLVITFLLIYFGMGAILFPMGDLSFVRDLPQMYHQCAQEDPDIDLCDFVFEHLMNIHDADDVEEQDKPHQAIYNHIPMQTLIALDIRVQHVAESIDHQFIVREKYPLIQNNRFQHGYLSSVFRPPSFS